MTLVLGHAVPLLIAAPTFAIGYALVFLGIILGLVPIVWPSRRKAEKKPEHEV